MATLGSRAPRWKAALWGSVCATLPDLDVFIPHGDVIQDMTLHRGDTHSLFWITLVAPLIAYGVSRIHREVSFARWWLLVWLALIFHPLLDVTTIYGTQLLRPFTDYPFGVGCIFIIDPLFSIPVIVGAAVALSWRSPHALRWNAAGMALSATYLAWSFIAQYHVTGIARQALRDQGIETAQVSVNPIAFNTVLWRVMALTSEGYVEGFYSLLDDTRHIEFRQHARGEALYERLRSNASVERLAWFTHGFFRMERRDGLVTITDLRLGMEPDFTFTFALFEDRDGRFAPITPRQVGPALGSGTREAFPWIWRRLKGEPLPPPP